MINHQSQSTDSVTSQSENRVAVLLAGYGEVQSYRDLSRYNQAATKYIAAQFVPIPNWLSKVITPRRTWQCRFPTYDRL